MSAITKTSISQLGHCLKRILLQLKQQALVVWFLARDPRTPLYLKLTAVAVAAYAFSPIDLIPDFIPVLGVLDDLILVPVGVYFVLRLSPPLLLEAARLQAAATVTRPRSRKAALMVIAIWIISLIVSTVFLWRWFGT